MVKSSWMEQPPRGIVAGVSLQTLPSGAARSSAARCSSSPWPKKLLPSGEWSRPQAWEPSTKRIGPDTSVTSLSAIQAVKISDLSSQSPL